MYEITDYTKRKAHELGVKVVPSVNSKKKIDIWKDGKRIASVGSYGTKVGSNGWWSDNLLW